jgi:hypothetical protein
MEEYKISEYLKVAPRYLRSVNLSSDWRNADSLEGYVITSNIIHALEQIGNGLFNENGRRAFTLIGPYGTGKSAFTVYLCQLLSKKDAAAEAANKMLCKSSPAIANSFSKCRLGANNKTKGFLPIILTSRRSPISKIILESLAVTVESLKKTENREKLFERIQKSIDEEHWRDTKTILKYLDDIGKEAKNQGYAGQLLLIDEAGKTLEYALQDKVGGDIYIFQEIAEYADRQKEFPLLFLITLHQMFDDYVELVEKTLRAEWNKVQERFCSIQFAESAAATIQMLAEALQHTKKLPDNISLFIKQTIDKMENSSLPLPIGLDYHGFRKIASKAWPLHPTVLLALPYLFRRLAQNERSIFSYLTSSEPFGFQSHAEKPLSSDSGFVRLHDIYDYLMANFEASLSRIPCAKKLLETNDIINSRQHLSKEQYNLIRIVSLLNVLGEISTIRANIEFMECASAQGCQVKIELEELKKQSILIFRNLDKSYRVWEGSDVDIDARMKEAQRKLQTKSFSFLETLRKQLPQQSFVARRHSFETGIHRFFNVVYTDRIEKLEDYENLTMVGDESGCILVVIPHADTEALYESVQKISAAQNRLIVACPKAIDELRMVIEELACLRWVEEHTPELRDDKVARRELSMRMVIAEKEASRLLKKLLDPRPAPEGNLCEWFWNGEKCNLQYPLDITRLLSKVCDKIYYKGPCLRNELVARKNISSAASSARRCLMEKMLNSPFLEKLGIEGFPPERSIYESVFKAAEIHVKKPDSDSWFFQAPPKDNELNLRPCWDLLEQEIFRDKVERVQLKDVFSLMSEVPYGLPDGVHPLLFTAFYVLNQDDLFLYRENTFIHDPQPAHFELMQRRPDLFSVSGARLSGIRFSVVNRLSKFFQTTPRTASVVRALFKLVDNLPQTTLKSARFKNKMVIKMRDLFLLASSPEELLFVDLPICFGLAPFNHNEEREDDIDIFFDNLKECLLNLQNHAQILQEEARDTLLKKCGLSSGKTGWEELVNRAVWLNKRVNHEILTPFLSSVVNGVIDNYSVKPALSFVANRPFELWTDVDAGRFPDLAEGVGTVFCQMWKNFGNNEPQLSEKERAQKKELRQKIEPELRKICDDFSRNALYAALMELAREFENEQ